MKSSNYLMVAFILVSASLFAATPKNVILFIGDGMSTPQRMTAEEFARKSGADRQYLYINRLPNQATTRTCSADHLVTDSAAAATAIACGEKTYNHGIGVDPKHKKLVSCAEVAKANGRKVGIVTTVTINHATPSGFYGHRNDRGDGYGLGLDLLSSNFDFFAGGGCDGHNNKGHKEYKGDIYELAAQHGYKVIREDKKAFEALKPSAGKVWYVGAHSTLPYSIDAEQWGNTPTLAEMTAKAMKMLENPKGFFLMVEAGKIDYAGHANDAAANLREVLALDDAVKEALKYQKKHSDTLIIVTGDHETGGMSMGIANTGYSFYMDLLANQKCSADAVKDYIAKNHISTFEELKPFFTENFGFEFSGSGAMALSDSQRHELESAFNHDLQMAKSGKKDAEAYDAQKISRLPATLKNIMSRKSGIGWTSNTHTALPVLTTSIGPGAEKFTGFLDNTDISKNIKAFFGK